jgi:hypothetical protein
MGAIVDLYELLLEHRGAQGLPYPFAVRFRMGGARLRTGQKVDVSVVPEEAGAVGVVREHGAVLPYLEAVLARETERGEAFPWLPSSFATMERSLSLLPYYRNCFVCGVDRMHPGLKRTFQLFGESGQDRVVVACAGFQQEDDQTVFCFHRNGKIHPLSLLALVDETMGWAGFMKSASGGVTVRMGVRFRRAVDVGEKLVVFACGEKVRSVGARMLFWSSGGAAVVGKGGTLEVVMTASSQFMGLSELTEQMRTELMPQELTSRAFEIAGSGQP